MEELLTIEGAGSVISDVDDWLMTTTAGELLMRAIRRVEVQRPSSELSRRHQPPVDIAND